MSAGAAWDEPVLIRTLHPDDGYHCGVAGDCDEPAEWSVELVGLDSRDEEPEGEAPHADACMAHLGWVAGSLLPKPAPGEQEGAAMSACTCPRNAPPGPPSGPEWHCHGCGYWNPSLSRDDRRTMRCRTCGGAR